jgi:hypothetical protein
MASVKPKSKLGSFGIGIGNENANENVGNWQRDTEPTSSSPLRG